MGILQLDEHTRFVILQFSFSNPDAVPPSVRKLNRETAAEAGERRGRSTGTQIIQPTEQCSIADFYNELQGVGYELVDAFFQERMHTQHAKTYQMIRFVFARRELVELSDEFREDLELVIAEFRILCMRALWRVRAFSNPFYQNGEQVSGQHVASINLEARQPFFRPGGTPVKIWQKDAAGNRIGDAPQPLVAKFHLRILDCAIQLIGAVQESALAVHTAPTVIGAVPMQMQKSATRAWLLLVLVCIVGIVGFFVWWKFY